MVVPCMYVLFIVEWKSMVVPLFSQKFQSQNKNWNYFWIFFRIFWKFFSPLFFFTVIFVVRLIRIPYWFNDHVSRLITFYEFHIVFAEKNFFWRQFVAGKICRRPNLDRINVIFTAASEFCGQFLYHLTSSRTKLWTTLWRKLWTKFYVFAIDLRHIYTCV